MKIQNTNSVTDFKIQNEIMLDSNLDGSSGLIADEPTIDRDLDLTVDDSEILVIPEVAEIEFLLVPTEPIDEVPPSLAGQYPLQTTIEDSQLVHTPIFPEVAMDLDANYS